MTITAAFATDDGIRFINRHFGDAAFYDVYEITRENTTFIKQIRNTSGEDKGEIHADPAKAKSVAGLLLEEGVNTAVSKIFGPNIKRIRKNFVCVICGDKTIKSAVRTIQGHIEEIEAEQRKGAERGHLRLASANSANEKIER